MRGASLRRIASFLTIVALTLLTLSPRRCALRVGGDAYSSLASLCTFKAGRCTASPQPDGSLKITPMKGKGTLNLTRTNASHSEGEGMIHLQWEDRKTKETPDKFIIFPSEAKFEEVRSCEERSDEPECFNFLRKLFLTRPASLA